MQITTMRWTGSCSSHSAFYAQMKTFDSNDLDLLTGRYGITFSHSMPEFSLQENWNSFQKLERRSDELSYSELMIYIEKIRSAGYDATRYVVELHAKLSYPFLSLVMVLIGIPFALKTARSGGVALNIGISILIAFADGVLFYVFLSFGKSGVLPPLVAAWTPTVLFSLAGVFTLMSVRQ